MELLTKEEYKDISCVYEPTITNDKQLEKLIKRATKVFHVETKNLYTEEVKQKAPAWLNESVKDSIVALVDYYLESGSTTLYGTETVPTSVNIGKTSVSLTSKAGAQRQQKTTVLPFEFYQALSDTGLLYKGV